MKTTISALMTAVATTMLCMAALTATMLSSITHTPADLAAQIHNMVIREKTAFCKDGTFTNSVRSGSGKYCVDLLGASIARSVCIKEPGFENSQCDQKAKENKEYDDLYHRSIYKGKSYPNLYGINNYALFVIDDTIKTKGASFVCSFLVGILSKFKGMEPCSKY
jgi:hypothetical protein